MNWKEFGQHLRAEKPGPAYWIHGDDPYFLSQAVSRIREALGGEEQTEIRRFSAAKGIPEAVSWAKTYTFFSTHRLVVVEKAQQLPQLPWFLMGVQPP